MPVSRLLRNLGIPAPLADALESRVVQSVEPKPRPRRSVVPRKAKKLASRIRQATHDEYFQLPEPVGRDTFVEGCRKVLADLPSEVLVVGFGKRLGVPRGRPSRITSMWVGAGDRSSVAFTDRGKALVRAQASTVERGESLIVHNHPPAWWRTLLADLIGWRPLPSLTDRGEAGRRHHDAMREFLQHHHDGFYRFYLVDEGEAEEFVLPPLQTCIDGLSRLATMSQQDQLNWLTALLRQAPWVYLRRPDNNLDGRGRWKTIPVGWTGCLVQS